LQLLETIQINSIIEDPTVDMSHIERTDILKLNNGRNHKFTMQQPLSLSKHQHPSSQKGQWQKLYPFPSHFFELPATRLQSKSQSTKPQREADPPRIHYLDQNKNESAAQSPVLMVHGNPTWSFYWRNLISSLEEQHRAVAVDHLGCGLSDKPADFDYCLQSHIDNLVALIDHLDLRNITLMAHDWGGAIGLGALLSRKERFRRIILFNTGAFRPHFIPFRIRVCRWPVVGSLAVRGLNLFARSAVQMATEQPGGLPSAVAEGLLFPYDNWRNRIAIDRFVKDIPLGAKHRTWQTLGGIEDQLADLADWPILMVWGMKDWCFRPDCLQKFQQFWPSAEVQELPQAGHYVVEDAIEQVNQRVLQFLEEHPLE